MAGPIMYVTDFSPNGAAALSYASKLAAQADADLYIVHVSEVLPSLDNPNPRYHTLPGIIQAESSAKASIEKIQPPDPGVRCIRRVLHGEPAEEIIRFASSHNVDLIVMSTHGRTGFLKLLMGSVAEGVVRDAECPVVIVKPKGEDGETA